VVSSLNYLLNVWALAPYNIFLKILFGFEV
jgi:hypothetical protein